MSRPTEVIILRETLWQSLASDTFTFIMAIGLILPGHLLGITALECVGALIFMLAIASKASATGKRMTPDDAIKHIEEIRAAAGDAP